MKHYSTATALVATLLLSLSCGGWTLQAELEQPQDFEPAELVESLEFTIEVGEGGEQLSEPVALDLGLGFPFWLRPLGTEQAEPLPVGALPQESPEQTVLQPGESATFVFRRDGDPGNDKLRFTPQLLDGVRFSDIARLGIISKGSTDWELAGYKLVINGKTFAARDDVRQKVRARIEKAQLEWIEARDALQALSQEQSDLTALEESGLATEEDRARLEEIRSEARPLEARIAWQQGVALGTLPWFVEEGLQIPGRESSSEIAAARVTLTTAMHTNAETSNYVYFRTGGKKYFLHPADGHFTPRNNSQTFDLFLPAGPLAASDVRGFALGMLAHDRPYAAAPDRWHPQRLAVEFEGRSVYDSEAAVIDRQSLQVIRLIPPAHLDGEGNIHPNEPNAVECFVWTAGQAQGIDLENGGAVQVGGEASETEPEPGISSAGTPTGDPGPEVAGGDTPAGGADTPGRLGGCLAGETPLIPDPWTDVPPDSGLGGVDGSDVPPWTDTPPDSGPGGVDGSEIPGWTDFPPDPGPGGVDGSLSGSGSGIPSGTLGLFPEPNVDTSAWDAFVLWLRDLVDAILLALGRIPGEPQPFGDPPQVENVRLLRTEDPNTYQVVWEISGDPSLVTDCTVGLWHIQPETGDFIGTLVAEQRSVPFETGMSALSPEGPVDPAGYLQPVIVVQTRDQEGNGILPQPGIGPALPWLLPEATWSNQPRPQFAMVASAFTPLMDREPDPSQPGVWFETVMRTADGINLATDGITRNVAVNDGRDWLSTRVLYEVNEPLDPTRRYELVGHVGLLDPVSEAAGSLTLNALIRLRHGAGGTEDPQEFEEPVVVYDAEHSGSPQLIRIPIDPSGFTDPPRLSIVFSLNGTDPAPTLPAIYGLRLVPVQQ